MPASTIELTGAAAVGVAVLGGRDPLGAAAWVAGLVEAQPDNATATKTDATSTRGAPTLEVDVTGQ